MARILILDDDAQLCDALALVVGKMGHEARKAHTLARGLELMARERYDVVLLDIRLPDGNGLEAMPAIRERGGEPEIIIISGAGDPDGAELAIRSGAWSYIAKPPTMNKIQLPVQRAVEYHAHKAERRPPVVLKRSAIVGESRALQECLDMVAQAAATEAGVLVEGETGTGKELFARAIHENSARAAGPFVVVDCAAMPERLVESELFGHEKGAFTGADRRSEGLVLQAHGGTLFLDEVGELPMAIQKAFLRVLQDRTFRPVGGVREVRSDFRLVAATNRDLDAMVANWAFRQDLLFRLRTISVHLPPLRERGGDVRLLARRFTADLCRRMGVEEKGLSLDFTRALEEYDWPGNVRELINCLESAIAASAAESALYSRHLPMSIRAALARRQIDARRVGIGGAGGGGTGRAETGPPPAVGSGAGDQTGVAPGPSGAPGAAPSTASAPPGVSSGGAQGPAGGPVPTYKSFRASALAELERQYLTDLMAKSGGDMRTACALSGLSRARLYALLKERGVPRGSG
ncbi:MAG: sigma-54-dependent Fis family transcriptional regulator [Desulfovibrionaceae bacterium]|jgi:DNA-binding NtrC family response regulator|nr:sigma-54-dependent Fis family transcriptional regulator [Desulfovibrionaceae bacterium]